MGGLDSSTAPALRKSYLWPKSTISGILHNEATPQRQLGAAAWALWSLDSGVLVLVTCLRCLIMKYKGMTVLGVGASQVAGLLGEGPHPEVVGLG